MHSFAWREDMRNEFLLLGELLAHWQTFVGASEVLRQFTKLASAGYVTGSRLSCVVGQAAVGH